MYMFKKVGLTSVSETKIYSILSKNFPELKNGNIESSHTLGTSLNLRSLSLGSHSNMAVATGMLLSNSNTKSTPAGGSLNTLRSSCLGVLQVKPVKVKLTRKREIDQSKGLPDKSKK